MDFIKKYYAVLSQGTRFVLLFISLLFATIGFAQTQHGYVKTRGRLDSKGNLIPGQGLKGALISIKDHTQVLVESDNGAFSFPVPNKHFCVDSVRKNGYQLVDMEFCYKTREYSSTPIDILMEIPGQSIEDYMEDFNRINASQQAMINQLRAEVKQLKTQNKINEEEYSRRLAEIADMQSESQKLVSEMAERYSKMDWDRLDDFNRQVGWLILNGELIKADSLIRSKGSMEKRSAELDQLHHANTEVRADLEKSEAVEAKTLEDFAADCFNLFEICKLRYANDSAAYWLELRAGKDTTNVEWGLDAARFIGANLGDFALSNTFVERALRQAKLQYGEEHEYTIACYDMLFMNHDKRLPYAKKALDLAIKVYQSDNHLATASRYNNLGMAYLYIDSLDLALKYVNKSVDIYRMYDVENRNLSSSYNNLGAINATMHNYDEALNCLYLAKEIRERQEDLNVHGTYFSIAGVYAKMEEYDSAFVYYNKALEIEKKIFGKKHLQLVKTYSGISSTYFVLGYFDKSEEFLFYALNALDDTDTINDSIRSISLANTYEYIAEVYHVRKEYNKALEYYNKALVIKKRFFNENHSEVLQTYTNSGDCYFNMGEYERAINCMEKEMEILDRFSIRDVGLIVQICSNIGIAYTRMKELDKAGDYVERAMALCAEESVDKTNRYGCYVNAAEYYAERGDVPAALDFMINASEIFDSVDFPNKISPNLFIARQYIAMNEFGSAIDYYQKELKRESLDSITQGDIFYYLGVCYLQIGEKDKALPYLLDAIDVFANIDEKKLLLADACNNVAIIYYQSENFDFAKINVLRAITYGQCDSIEENPELADYYYTAGLVYAKLGLYEDALEFFTVAERYFEKLYGKNNIKMAEILQNKAAAYYDLRQEQDAVIQMSNALSVLLTIVVNNSDAIIPRIEFIHEIIVLKSDNSEYIEGYEKMLAAILNTYQRLDEDKYQSYIILLMNDLGNLYYSQNRFEESINMYSSIIDNSRDEQKIAIMKMNLANVYLNMEHFSESEQLYISALQFFEQQNEKDSSEYSQWIEMLLEKLANLYFITQRYDEELECYLKLEVLMKENNSPNLINVYDNISQCYKEMGNYSKAMEYNKKAFYLIINK